MGKFILPTLLVSNLLVHRELGNPRAQKQLTQIYRTFPMYAGDGSSFIVKNNRVLACGNNEHGQLGLGYSSPSQTTLMENTFFTEKIVQSIVVGGNCSFFRMKDGSIYACGYNEYGQLGLGYCSHHEATPTEIKFFKERGQTVKSIAGRDNHTLFLIDDESVFVCGYNQFGQLGLGYCSDHEATPTKIKFIIGKKVQSITAGNYHSLFLMEDSVFACGDNSYRQLGLSDISNYDKPTEILSLSGKRVQSIVAGATHSLFLLEDGRVFTCGDNAYGQLGLGHIPGRYCNTPTEILSLSGKRIQSIVAGATHSLFRMEDGSVFACGDNTYGQLGLGDTSYFREPTEISSLRGKGVSSIVAGGFHSLFQTIDRRVLACGSNKGGELGLGHTTNSHTPIAVF